MMGHVLNVGAGLEARTTGLATQIADAHDFALELVLPGSMYLSPRRPHPHNPSVSHLSAVLWAVRARLMRLGTKASTIGRQADAATTL